MWTLIMVESGMGAAESKPDERVSVSQSRVGGDVS